MSTKKDTIVRKLTPEDVARLKARGLRVGDIHEGRTRCGIRGIRGAWRVWSRGPETGTWWLQPTDPPAHDAYARLLEKPSRGEPVVTRAMQGCVAAATRDLHWLGGA